MLFKCKAFALPYTAKKMDRVCPHNTKRACTILLFAKKIKKFISLARMHLGLAEKAFCPFSLCDQPAASA
jgi:hypothetical protein